ncbi:hypothetical protein C7M37_01843 [Lactiplantibacillus plantarum]|nr:hypothetical protein C7M37_01843 [Lactiplantibacillus plantarum]
MFMNKWYGLGFVGVILVGISQILPSINGEVVSFTLVMALLGGIMTEHWLAPRQTESRFSVINEVVFILQSLLVLLVLVLAVSWVVEPSFEHLYGAATQPLRTIIWSLPVDAATMHNVFFHLWPVVIYVIGLLWLRVTVQIAECRQLPIRQTLIFSNGCLALFALVINSGWLFTRSSRGLPTSLFLLSFAVGGLIVAWHHGRVTSPAIQRGPLDTVFALICYAVLFMIGGHSATFQNHWLQLVWLVIGCLGSGWLLWTVQPMKVNVRQWHLLMTTYLWYLYYWALVWLLDGATRPGRALSVLPLALIIAMVDYAGYQWLTRRVDGYHRQLLVSVAVICLVVLGSFSNYQASKITPQHQVKAERKAGTEPKATANSSEKVTAVDPKQQRQQLLAAWQKIIDHQSVKVGITIYSPRSKQSVTYNRDTDGSGYYVASTIKASVLTELLHQRDRGQLTFTSGEQTLAESMIRYSDNNAATGLLSNGLGSYGALNNLYQNLQMTHTTANLTSWSMTKTTPADQVKLLRTIYYPSNYLTSRSKHYIQNLMGTVSHEQSWGVSKDAPDYQLKNGWMDLSDNGLGWQVNSIGHVYDKHRDPQGYVIAIYTNQDATMQQGVTLVESLAAATHKIMQPSH